MKTVSLFCIVLYYFVCSSCVESRQIYLCDNRLEDHSLNEDELAKSGDFKGLVHLEATPQPCGGTLIHPRLILTAAHCFYNNEHKLEGTEQVNVASNSCDSQSIVFTPQKVDVEGDVLHAHASDSDKCKQTRIATKVVIHPDYKDDSRANDIALVFLDQPFNETSTFGPVEFSLKNPVDNELCHVAGWGVIEGIDQNELVRTDISVVPTNICNDTQHRNGSITTGSFCAGDLVHRRDSCRDASGGGLICGGVIRGIVSRDDGCGVSGKLAVFSNVNYYKHWIEFGSDNLINLSNYSTASSSTIAKLSIEISFILYGVHIFSSVVSI